MGEVFQKVTVEGGRAMGLTSALRSWAGLSLDERCESCGGEFYSRSGSPVCMGCLRGDDYQLGLVRARLLRALFLRVC